VNVITESLGVIGVRALIPSNEDAIPEIHALHPLPGGVDGM